MGANDSDDEDGLAVFGGLADPAATAEPAAAAERPVVVWDLVTSILLLVLMFAVAAVATFLSLFLGFAGDGCGIDSCDDGLMRTGEAIAISTPAVVVLAVAVLTIVRLWRRRLGWWVALIGVVLAVVPLVVGTLLVFAGSRG